MTASALNRCAKLMGGLLHLVQRGGGCGQGRAACLGSSYSCTNVTAHPSTASRPISITVSVLLYGAH